MAGMLLSQPPTSRQDIVSSILNDYAESGYGGFGSDDGSIVPSPPPYQAAGLPSMQSRLDKPLPSLAPQYPSRVDSAGTRPPHTNDHNLDHNANASALRVSAKPHSHIPSRSIDRSGRPGNLHLSNSNGATAFTSKTSSSNLAVPLERKTSAERAASYIREAGASNRLAESPSPGATAHDARQARADSSCFLPAKTYDPSPQRPLPSVPKDRSPSPPPAPPKQPAVMGGSFSRGLPSNPRDVSAGRSPFSGKSGFASAKGKFATGKRKPVPPPASEKPSAPTSPVTTVTAPPPSLPPLSSTTSALSLQTKSLPSFDDTPAQSAVSSGHPSSRFPSTVYSSEISTSTAPTSTYGFSRSGSSRAARRPYSPSGDESDFDLISPTSKPFMSPSPVEEEAFSQIKGSDWKGSEARKESKRQVIGLPSGPKLSKGLGETWSDPFRKKSTPIQPSRNNAGTLSPPRSPISTAPAPAAKQTGPSSRDQSRNVSRSRSRSRSRPAHSHGPFPPATPDSIPSEHYHAPPTSRRESEWIHLVSRPANTNAPPLSDTHIDCFVQHRRFYPSRNALHPVACMLCFTEGPGRGSDSSNTSGIPGPDRMTCAFCALRLCRDCHRRLVQTKGRDVKQLIDLGRASRQGPARMPAGWS